MFDGAPYRSAACKLDLEDTSPANLPDLVALRRDDAVRPGHGENFGLHSHEIANRNPLSVREGNQGVPCDALTEIRQAGAVPVLGACLGRARELREREDGDAQLLGEFLERAADVRDLLLARIVAPVPGHELQIVDDEE